MLNTRGCRLIGLLSLALVLVGCGAEPPPQQTHDGILQGRLLLSGSSTLAPLAAEIGKRFESLHPGVRVDVQTGGSSRGIADPVRGLADIGMSSRGLKGDEHEGRNTHVVARDGVALLVHASNPVTELSRDQIVAIFTGQVDNWQAFGGPDAAITVVNRNEGRSELELFTQFFGLEKNAIQPDLVSGENQHGIRTVAGDPHAITYMSVGASEYDIDRGAPLKLLPLDGIAASVANVKDGSFPLNRPLIFITPPESTQVAQAYLAFALSAEVNDLIEQQAYVPVNQ